MRPAQACQLPIGPRYAGGWSGVVNDASADQAPPTLNECNAVNGFGDPPVTGIV